MMSSGAFAELDDRPLWVAWQTEDRPNAPHGTAPTKVPYAPNGGKARADDARTWGTRAEAEARATKLPRPYGDGGVGIELGDLGGGRSLGGVDLDSCRDPTCHLAPWAIEVLKRFGSYSEVSPSETGVKLLFIYATAELMTLRDIGLIEAGKGGRRHGFGRQFKLGTGKHPPAIELYLGNRYFAITDQRLPDAPDELRTVPLETLLWLLQEAGPALAAQKEQRPNGNGKDNSRSATAFAIGAVLRRQGKSFEEMCDRLRAEPDTAEWVREKGDANNGRELQRIWANAAPSDDRQPTIRVSPGRRHEAADAGLNSLTAASVAFYQRDRSLVRVCALPAKASDGSVVWVPAVVPITTPMLGRALGQAARWETANRKGEICRIDPPKEVVEQIGAMVGGTATLRPDGSLLTTEGYDAATGLFLFKPPPMPPIPSEPTQRDAMEALALLNALLVEFPFANDESRSVAMSMLLTPVLRGALAPAVPMHCITAPGDGEELSAGCSVLHSPWRSMCGDFRRRWRSDGNRKASHRRRTGAAAHHCAR